jgi:hypothetical protein
MLHQVARSIGGRPLFRTWAEARWLWLAVLRATPGRVALVLMPEHLHVIHPTDVRRSVAAALSGFVRRRHHAWNERGPVFEPLPDPTGIADPLMLRRSVRYVHLNPCRRHLVDDPLAWPFSSHRDACGLALPGVVDRVRDPVRFHRYVSSDPTSRVDGTDLPVGPAEIRDPRLVAAAVSALTRTPVSAFAARGRARSLAMAAARALCPEASCRAKAAPVGAHPKTPARARADADAIRLVARLVGDPRFPALHDRPLIWKG